MFESSFVENCAQWFGHLSRGVSTSKTCTMFHLPKPSVSKGLHILQYSNGLEVSESRTRIFFLQVWPLFGFFEALSWKLNSFIKSTWSKPNKKVRVLDPLENVLKKNPHPTNSLIFPQVTYIWAYSQRFFFLSVIHQWNPCFLRWLAASAPLSSHL